MFRNLKVLLDPASGNGPLPSSYTATFSLCPHMVEREGERGSQQSPISFYKGSNPITKAPPS